MKKREDFKSIKKLVVKVGSSSLTYDTGRPNISRMESLAMELADLHNKGVEVLLVTSGAVGMGRNRLGFSMRPGSIPEKQAAAAVGQGMLMHLYEKLFAEYGVVVGQVLLTREDFSDRRRFLNARNTLFTLLAFGAIPVINENDTVAVDEIRLGDNDNLAALVGGLVDADMLVMLSDVDGLYPADPRQNPGVGIISEVGEITGDMEGITGEAGSMVGTGGIATKIQAAKVAMHSGMVMVLANAAEKNIVGRVLAGEEIGTVFWPQVKLENRKRWIAYSACAQGKIHVDSGAARALTCNGKSLLPSGITGIDGSFDAGNIICIIDHEGREIARGIVNYSAADIYKIKGRHSHEIKEMLGYRDYDEVVHRNNLVSML